MGNFGSNRFGGKSRDRDRGRSDSRNRGRFGGRDSRRPLTMHDVTCNKCGIKCQVPFRPTGDKPVLCSDCFRKNNSSNSSNFSSRNQSGSQSGATSEQLNQINKKLDKILLVLKDLELETDDEDEIELGEDLEDNDEEELDEDSEDEELDEEEEDSDNEEELVKEN